MYFSDEQVERDRPDGCLHQFKINAKQAFGGDRETGDGGDAMGMAWTSHVYADLT